MIHDLLPWLNLLMIPMVGYLAKGVTYMVKLETRLTRVETELRHLMRSRTDWGEP